MKPKARETQIDLRTGRWGAAEGKVVRPVSDLGRLAIRDLVNVHSRRVEKAAVKELHFERQFLPAPQCSLGQKTYRAVVIVIQALQVVRQFRIRGLERFA